MSMISHKRHTIPYLSRISENIFAKLDELVLCFTVVKQLIKLGHFSTPTHDRQCCLQLCIQSFKFLSTPPRIHPTTDPQLWVTSQQYNEWLYPCTLLRSVEQLVAVRWVINEMIQSSTPEEMLHIGLVDKCPTHLKVKLNLHLWGWLKLFLGRVGKIPMISKCEWLVND